MNLEQSINRAARTLINTGKEVKANNWQSVKAPQPFWEALFVYIQARMPESIDDLAELVKPNLPWANEHFSERVSGTPHNPPPSHKIWPFGSKTETFTKDTKFSHTYPERFWPKYVNNKHPFDQDGKYPNRGIRYEYGDLQDIVNLLINDIETRQAYLPVWFPEDTGVVHGERVPCTLGYHFIIRNNHLHMTYYIRSCDFLRHFRDDIYLAVRLAHWVVDGLNTYLSKRDKVLMGMFNMHIGSLHIFKPELNRLIKEYGN